MRYNKKIDKFIEENQGKHLCQCGCGQTIKIERRYFNRGIPRYIHLHMGKGENSPRYKGVDKWIEENQGKHLCQCGCGQEIIIKDKHHCRGIPEYINGHFVKTEKSKNAQSERTKLPIDEEFFNLPLNKVSAYVFGFLMADGSMGIYKNRKKVSIGYINIKDINLIKKIKEVMNSEHELAYRRKKNQVGLFLQNGKIYDSLLRLGMAPRKSLCLKFPDYLDNELFPHFLRGYFDGDGSVGWQKGNNNFPRLGFTFTAGTKSFLEEIKIRLFEFYNIRSHKIYKQKDSNSHDFDISGKEAFNLRELLYKDATIYLDRKKSVAYKVKERLLKSGEFAERLNMIRATVWDWGNRYNLPYIQKGGYRYYSSKEISEWQKFIRMRKAA